MPDAYPFGAAPPAPLVIRFGMTSRVGPKGQVVIPHQLRRQLGIEPGDEVEFWLDGDHVAVRPVAARGPLRGRFTGTALTEELPRETTVRQAAAIKATHPMSYVDAFAVATAIAHDGVLWTGDPELLVPDAPWRTHDLRG